MKPSCHRTQCRRTRPKRDGTSIVAIALLFAVSVRAAEVPEDAFTLESRPSVCVSYNRDLPCRMPLVLEWHGAATDACVRESSREPWLQCWQQSREGRLEVEFSNIGDVQYLLQQQTDGRPLAEAEVKVINRDLRSSRKRRRHVWSIL